MVATHKRNELVLIASDGEWFARSLESVLELNGYAVQRAIEKFEQILLRDHLNHCVPDGIREGRDEEVLGELEQLFSLSRG